MLGITKQISCIVCFITLVACSNQEESLVIKKGQTRASVIQSLGRVNAVDIGDRFQVMSLSGEIGYPGEMLWEVSKYKIMLQTEFSGDKLIQLNFSDLEANPFPQSKADFLKWEKIQDITFNRDKTVTTTASP